MSLIVKTKDGGEVVVVPCADGPHLIVKHEDGRQVMIEMSKDEAVNIGHGLMVAGRK
jgi:hypothetical protein